MSGIERVRLNAEGVREFQPRATPWVSEAKNDHEHRRSSRMSLAIVGDIREPLQGSMVILDVATQGVTLGYTNENG